MAVGTIVSRVTGVLRDTALGAALGTAVLGDTFAVANTIPNTIYALLAGGAISAVFVPQLVRHLKEDDDGGDGLHPAAADPRDARARRDHRARRRARTVHRAAVRDVDVDRARTSTSRRCSRVFCLPQILFYGLYTMFQQVLNARGHFAAPMFAPILNNVVVIATCGAVHRRRRRRRR